MTFTIEIAQAHLDAYLQASLALATGKEHYMNGRKLVSADADEILRMIKYWKGIVDSFSTNSNGGVGIKLAKWS